MRVLITGSSGFIGTYLKEYCLAGGHRTYGLDIAPDPDQQARKQYRFFPVDVRDRAGLRAVLKSVRPERVFHLAAQSYPTVSWEKPVETMEINANGTIHLFEELHSLGLQPMVVVACSSAEYGPVADRDLPVREEHGLQPLHPYGVSKVAQDLLAAQYFANTGMPCVRIRIFNTTGPGKRNDVCSDLTRRAAEIELGLRPPHLEVGNLKPKRAIADVRDMVSGLWLAGERGKPGEVYNLGSDQLYPVRELVAMIRKMATVRFDVVPVQSLLRPSDEKIIWGDISRFRKLTRWKAEVPMEQTLRDMLVWWRQQLIDGESAQGA